MCPHEEKLTAWLLGDLPPTEQKAMTRHVDGCCSCRAAADELSRVLTPLRSGLAKDSRLRIEPQAAPRRSLFWSWLWRSPHEGLKRAALLAVSFGTLFALLSTLYQSAQRETAPAGTVTNIEFKKRDDSAAPALEPLAAPRAEEADAERLFKGSGPRAEPFAVESKPVPYPTPPAAVPSMPALRRLPAHGSALREAAAAPAEAAPAAAPEPTPKAQPAKNETKRERAKAKATPITRPPADLQVKPALLAGVSLAATNAPSTNAVPTNAVAPKHTGKP